MLPRFRNIVLLLLLTVNCGSLFATVSATAKLTVTGGEQQPNGVWDSGSIAISFNGFSETVSYAQFSNSSSIASAFAAKFTRDYHRYGLWAKAGANSNSDPNVVTFQLTNGQTFSSINYSLPSTSFVLTPSGFASSLVDSGTVKLQLQVNGVTTTIASALYGAGSTPTLIAQSLADAASSSLVSVQSDGNLLYLASKQTGSAVNYPYSITISHDSTDFTNPSFQISPMSDTMSGGANASSQTGPIYSYSVTNSSGGSGYDAAGNILNLTDSVMGTWTYGYDSLNRLVAGHASSGAYTSQNPYICWSYDGFGNRTHQSLSNQPFVNAVGSACQAASGASLVDTSTVPATNNRITSSTLPGSSTVIIPSYDAAGNILSDGVNTYLYDAEGRVCAVHGTFGMTGYQYDADGIRIGKGSITTMSCDITANGYLPTNDYVLDQSGGQMTELAVDENGVTTWQHTNVTANGMLIATYDLTGLHFYMNDALGSRRAQTDLAGVLEQNCLSLPFGDQLNCTTSTSGPTEHHFTGKERDAESGLDYFGARYYGSSMGRFMSPDWKSGPDAVPYADLRNPQTLNLYSYVLNNPLSKVDPNGHDWFHVDNKWQWQNGHVFHDAKGNATKDKGYAGLLIATTNVDKNGKPILNEKGSTTFHLTLYNQNQIAAQGEGFSGSSHYSDTGAVPDGNYSILGRLDVPPTAQNPLSRLGDPPPVYGYQMIDPSLGSYASQVYGAYGPIRARLNPLDGQLDGGYYLHAQEPGGFHDEGWTHGCLSTGEDASMIFYMQSHIGSAGVSVNTPVLKP